VLISTFLSPTTPNVIALGSPNYSDFYDLGG